MPSRTELLYHQQASSSGFMVSETLNPRDAHTINGDTISIRSSNPECASDLLSSGDQRLSGSAPAPSPSPSLPPPGPPPPSQKDCPPPALEEANVDDAPRLPPPSSHSIISAPIPNTPMKPRDNLDTFIRTLRQELHHSPDASIMCSVKRNDEPETAHDGPLEQRLEKKMNVQLSIIGAANQRIKLPVPPATFDIGVSEPRPAFLSLVVAGETTRRIFGGVGLYHPNQTRSGLINIIEGSNFSPIVGITSGKTVCIGFKFTTYPRQCDPSEEAFRVIITIHDCDGKLVAYSLSTSAYSVKSHPRNIKRPLQASTEDSEDTGNPRSKRRRTDSALATTSSTAGNPTLPSNSSPAGGSNQQQFCGSSNAGGPPIVEPAVDRPGGTPIPIVDPRLQPPLQEPRPLLSLNPIEGSQSMPTLDEAVPASCSWRGGIVIALLVNNLPQDGPIYARFGFMVVKTDRKSRDVLGCKVPAAAGACEVDLTLSRSSGPFDEQYGWSICKFTYEEDDITRIIRTLKAEGQGPLWNAAAALQEYASRNRLIPSQSSAYQSTYDQSILGSWPLPSYARLEVVEDEIETENDVAQPETSNNVPNLGVTSHVPSVSEDKRSNSTGTERGGNTEGARGQDTRPLDMVPLSGTEDYTMHSTTSVYQTPNPTVIHDYILNSPPLVTQQNQPARHNPINKALFGNASASQQSLEIARLSPPNQQIHTSPTSFWAPSISAQILPPSGYYNVAYESLPTNAMTSTLGFGVKYSAHRTASDLGHFYNDSIRPSYRNIHLECHLKRPKDYEQNGRVIIRLEKRVVLEVQLRGDYERMGWKGIALPKTVSVKQTNQQAPTRLLYFSIQVHGSTTGMALIYPCPDCWPREMPLGHPRLTDYLIDFKSDSPFILFSRHDLQYAKAEVTFRFTCSSHHQLEDYKLVARLHDEQGKLVANHHIPYSFRSAAGGDKKEASDYTTRKYTPIPEGQCIAGHEPDPTCVEKPRRAYSSTKGKENLMS